MKPGARAFTPHKCSQKLGSPHPTFGEGNGTPLRCSCLENPRDGKPGGLPSMGSHRVGTTKATQQQQPAAAPHLAVWRGTPQLLPQLGDRGSEIWNPKFTSQLHHYWLKTFPHVFYHFLLFTDCKTGVESPFPSL